MTEITRELEFDMGHRLMLHGGKCSSLHGHRYKLRVTAIGALKTSGEACGMVADFSTLKSRMAVITDFLDHKLMLQDEDPVLLSLGSRPRVSDTLYGGMDMTVAVFNPALGVLSSDFTPTAENLARFVAKVLSTRWPDLFSKGTVTLWETPNCYATCKIE